MQDQKASEEKLMGELELMYQHAVDLEGDDVPGQHHHDPKIIPFPGKGIESSSWEPLEISEPSEASAASELSEPLEASESTETSKTSKTSKASKASEAPEASEASEALEALEEEPLPEKEPFSRTYVIVVSVSVIFLASVLLMVILDLITGPRGSKKREPLEVTAPIQLKSSPPVQKQENVSQTAEQRQPQTETIPQETVESKSPARQTVEPESHSGQTVASKSPTHRLVEPKSPRHQTALPEPIFTESMHYAVQVGAFSSWRNASRRVDSLRKKSLETYWIARQSRSRGTVYVIFAGSFTNSQEAVQFMEGKDIRKNYPGSFVRGISFDVENHSLEGSATPTGLGSDQTGSLKSKGEAAVSGLETQVSQKGQPLTRDSIVE
jgi:septal ring-binding cell division protein DamX